MAWTNWVMLGALLAAVGVGAGAFGAHGLKDKLSPEYLAVFETAVRYQMYHAFGLIAVGLVATRIDSTAIRVAGIAFLAGILLFSGSLYMLVFSGTRAWGMVTPIGGLGFILGWLALAVAALRS